MLYFFRLNPFILCAILPKGRQGTAITATMYNDTKALLEKILNVFDKYDKTNIPSDITDVPIVDLVTEDTVSIACYFSITDGSVSQAEADVFNTVFGTLKTPEEMTEMIDDGESILERIGTTFNVIAETEKVLGIYTLHKTMIVPLIKFFESFADNIIRAEEYDESEIEAFNIFFSKIESVLTAIPRE